MSDLSVEKLKSIFRQNLKTQRAQVPLETAKEAGENLWGQLKEEAIFQKAKRIAAFTSTGTEISTYPLLEGILRSGKDLYLPKTEKNQPLIHFHVVTDLNTLVMGPFDIKEPAGGPIIQPSKIDLLLVPGLAFDNRGHRLGYGKGYYDRFIKILDPNCYKLGISYYFQIINKIPDAEHDIPVNAVLTDKFIMLC